MNLTLDPEKVICIDPGHGGSRDGAKYGYTEEDDLNLQGGYYVDYELRLGGIPTLLTRQRDIELAPTLQQDLRARVDMANNNGADVLVSIHCDAFHKESVHGLTIHIHPKAKSMTRLYAGMVYDHLRGQVPRRHHRGIKESDFFVLRHTKMPAILVECEFLSNPESRKWVHEPENLRDIARAISKATIEFCRGTARIEGGER